MTDKIQDATASTGPERSRLHDEATKDAYGARSSTDAPGWVSTVGHEAKLFSEGVVTGAILDPVNAVGQLSNHVFGTHLDRVKLSNQEEVDNSFGGKVGEITGTILDVGALTLGAGEAAAALGIAERAAGLTSMSVAAGIRGGFFTPTAEKPGESVWSFLGQRAVLGVGSFAIGKWTGMAGTKFASGLRWSAPGFFGLAVGQSVVTFGLADEAAKSAESDRKAGK